MKRNLIVEEGAAGERLDVFLAAALSITRSQAQTLLDAGLVEVNGHVSKPGHKVRAGDKIIASEPPAPAQDPPAEIPKFKVVYEDSDVLVIDKPAGIQVHEGSGQPPGGATVADFARRHTTDPDPVRPGIVHRLDRDTSGLLVLAKSAEAKEAMQRQFRDRTVHKTYLALVVGRIDPPEAEIRLPVDRSPANPLKQAVVPGGRAAVTKYRTLAAYPGYTLVEAEPLTGRTHQIRVHFAALGHPVAGDITYGPPQRPLGLNRHFLHAEGIRFTPPAGHSITLKSPLPTDLEEVLSGFKNQV